MPCVRSAVSLVCLLLAIARSSFADSTTTYCLVDGHKVKFYETLLYDFCYRREEAGQDAKLKCWKEGEVVIDLDIAKGKKTGFATYSDQNGTRRISYRDGVQHGEQKTVEHGKLRSLAWYDNGVRVWEKTFDESGALKRYTRSIGYGTSQLVLDKDGKIEKLRCASGARDDPELRGWCGFEGTMMKVIYGHGEEVKLVQTWKGGALQKESPGTSDDEPYREVWFKDGRKQGEEREFDGKGGFVSKVTWDHGMKEGKELEYADDGKKIVKEMLWQAGKLKQLTEFYFNGNPKLKENYDSPEKKQSKSFWDTGHVSQEGEFAWCPSDDHRDWCENGVHRSYFENGALKQEMSFRLGKREGTSTLWWPNGKTAMVESHTDDRLTKAKRWDENGKLVADEEFEADGSRKLKR